MVYTVSEVVREKHHEVKNWIIFGVFYPHRTLLLPLDFTTPTFSRTQESGRVEVYDTLAPGSGEERLEVQRYPLETPEGRVLTPQSLLSGRTVPPSKHKNHRVVPVPGRPLGVRPTGDRTE